MADILYLLIDYTGHVYAFHEQGECLFWALQYFGTTDHGQCMPEYLT